MPLAETLKTHTTQLINDGVAPGTLGATYREYLERQGIAFPSPEIAEARRLRDTWSQWRYSRNREALQFDPDTFDEEENREMLAGHDQLFLNAERLESITTLGFLSTASSLVVPTPRGRLGVFNWRVRTAGRLAEERTTKLLRFVQLAIETEQWPRPWRTLVREKFRGEALDFPLDQHGVEQGMQTMDNELFDDLYRRHFGPLSLLRFNIGQKLANADRTGIAPETQYWWAARAGLFYNHSPQGCDRLIRYYIRTNILSAEIDWRHEVPKAVKSARRTGNLPYTERSS